MVESTVNHPWMESLQPANVSYLVSDTLFIQTDEPFVEGEEIAQGVTIFYGKENGNQVVGIMIDGAEDILKPFVDAILAKRDPSGGDATPDAKELFWRPTSSRTPSTVSPDS